MTVENTNIAETINITTNGQYDVARYTTANVNTPAAPDYYISKAKDANNKLVSGSTIIDLTGITDLGAHVLESAYYSNMNISGNIDLSSITKISGDYALNSAFYSCGYITGVDLSNLEEVTATRSAVQECFHYCTGITGIINLGKLKKATQQAFNNAFNGCTGITGVNLSSLEIVGNSSFSSAFQGCTGITGTIDLSKIVDISTSSSALSSMFNGCKNITAINLSGLKTIYNSQSALQSVGYGTHTSLESINLSNLYSVYSSQSALQYFFAGSDVLTSFTFNKLVKLQGNSILSSAFYNCSALETLSFPNLCYSSDLNTGQFQSMLNGCIGVTVHFPAELESLMQNWASVTSGFGGTNTTVLFDLPSITTLDLSNITEVKSNSQLRYAFSYLPNITSVDLSGLTSVDGDYSCSFMFSNNTNMTSINISGLKEIKATESFDRAFENTKLTSITFNSLETINGSRTMVQAFRGCTQLTSVSFPALKTISSNIVFSSMLSGCSNVTVHFPSNFTPPAVIDAGLLQGTNTTVLYDLPATA